MLEWRDVKEPARRDFASLRVKGVFIVELFALCGHYYVLCKFSLARTAFPRTPFPIWFLVTVAHRTVCEIRQMGVKQQPVLCSDSWGVFLV